MSTLMTSTPIIPPELVDIILDHAHNDLFLLTACSLVCKAWFPSARHYIFYSASLDAQNASIFLCSITQRAIFHYPPLYQPNPG